MPLCRECHRVAVKNDSDLCPSCEEYRIEEADREAEKVHEEFINYSGDQWLVDSWLEDDGVSLEKAIQIVEDPAFISWPIEMGQLHLVLADKYATRALKKALMEGNRRILFEFKFWIQRLQLRRKPGRKPKGREYKHDYQRVYELRKRDLTFGQIAQQLWHGEKKANHASALYKLALRRGYPHIVVRPKVK